MRIAILPFLLLSLLLGACSSKSEQAAAYNDQIMELQARIIDRFNAMDSAKVNFHNVEEMELAHLELQTEIRQSIQALKKIKPFKQDEGFKEASLDMFDAYKEISDEHYQRLLFLLSKPDSAYTKMDESQVAAVQNTISQKFDQTHDSFVEKQQAFGEKYNVEFIESEAE